MSRGGPIRLDSQRTWDRAPTTPKEKGSSGPIVRLRSSQQILWCGPHAGKPGWGEGTVAWAGGPGRWVEEGGPSRPDRLALPPVPSTELGIAAAVGPGDDSRRWLSGSLKYTPRPPSLWLISPPGSGPVVQAALDPAEDRAEVVLADQERLVLGRDLDVRLVIVERDTAAHPRRGRA
jgi:hypothetical protein